MASIRHRKSDKMKTRIARLTIASLATALLITLILAASIMLGMWGAAKVTQHTTTTAKPGSVTYFGG
jgi:hypothetical protein